MTSGTEVVGREAAADGVAPEGLAAAARLVRARGARAQLVVLRDGVTVLDRAFGCAPDALFYPFSASKAYTSVLVHRLVERGALDPDEPVAATWPGFGRHGKGAVTVRHVLRHRSGFATAGAPLGEALSMTDWDRMVRRLELTRLRWPPGEVPAYRYLAYGFVLGEVLRRVTGRELPALLHDEVLAPLGVHDTFLGLPDEAWPRHVPVRPGAASAVVVTAAVNRRSTRAAVIPSAGVSTTARDLAAFYQALLSGGTLLRPETLARATRPTSDGEVDRFTRLPVRWSEGFQLGGPRTAGPPSPMGACSSPRAFGHNGSDCCIGWADPDRGLVVAYLTDRLGPLHAAMAHLTAVADAILDAAPAPRTALP
ncbi:MAG TPA: serine hydrolase domain-containing protein [Rugosimonospora sp.]|nr:serine hydrolase domain-containing protein [Rugosimonospora sp.]